MKGVVLAGGTGSRLNPLTRVANKHLLPVYNKPMVNYPIQTLVNAGIHEILLVTGGKNAGDFLRLLGNGVSKKSPRSQNRIMPWSAFTSTTRPSFKRFAV
jgi:dTDP-glucose pyrophosphorylase